MTLGAPQHTQTVACYRHGQTPAVTTCNRCNRPICTQCMVSAPVGWQCTECVHGHMVATGMAESRPLVTIGMVAISVAVYVVGAVLDITAGRSSAMSLGLSVIRWLGLNADTVAAGQWWRILTAGFLHFSILHIGFNMWVVWLLGSMLEPRWGHLRYLLVYLTALFGGSFGAIVLSPNAVTGGASGAGFGLMAGAFIASRFGGRNALRAQIGGLIVANLIFTFLAPGISVGGHLGGLLAGGLAALVYEWAGRQFKAPNWLTTVIVAGLCVSLFMGTVLAAQALA